MSRDEAGALLHDSKIGSYVIRISPYSDKPYAISLKNIIENVERVRHFEYDTLEKIIRVINSPNCLFEYKKEPGQKHTFEKKNFSILNYHTGLVYDNPIKM
jgi:hypothetical protein